jgi:hypothetical protein
VPTKLPEGAAATANGLGRRDGGIGAVVPIVKAGTGARVLGSGSGYRRIASSASLSRIRSTASFASFMSLNIIGSPACVIVRLPGLPVMRDATT